MIYRKNPSLHWQRTRRGTAPVLRFPVHRALLATGMGLCGLAAPAMAEGTAQPPQTAAETSPLVPLIQPARSVKTKETGQLVQGTPSKADLSSPSPQTEEPSHPHGESPRQGLTDDVGDADFIPGLEPKENLDQPYTPTAEEDAAIAKLEALSIDVTARGYANKTALHCVAMEGKTALLNALLDRGAAVNAVDQDGMTPLHEAAAKGHTETVLALLARGGRVDATTLYDFTPLHLAAEGGHTETVSALLAHGANINALTGNEATALHLAVMHKHAKTAELLLRKGAKTETRDANESTPLLRAVEVDSWSCILALLNAGAHVNTKGYEGETPLHVAAAQASESVVKLLIKRGAQVQARDDEGHTPLDAAKDAGKAANARVLTEAMRKTKP